MCFYTPYNSLLTIIFVTPYRSYTIKLLLQPVNALIGRVGKVFGRDWKFKVEEASFESKKPWTIAVKQFTVIRRKVLPAIL